MSSIYFVYVYEDPTTNVPFYVGYGKGNRHQSHLLEAIRNPDPKQNQHKLNKIRKILKNGTNPTIKIVESGISKEDACDLETLLISEIGRIDLGTGPLTNKTLGGDGCRGWSDAQKSAMSMSRKGTIMAKDPNTGSRIRISSDDPRWGTGDLVGANMGIKISNTDNLKGFVLAKDPITGDVVRVKKTDDRWVSGQLQGINKGKPPSENALIAARARKGIPKTKEHVAKISASMQELLWYYNFQSETIGRFRLGEQPAGFERICGPHKKMTLDQVDEENRRRVEEKRRHRDETKATRIKNNSNAQLKFSEENPLHKVSDSDIETITKILLTYATKPALSTRNSTGKIISYARAFAHAHQSVFGVSFHKIFSTISGTNPRRLLAIAAIKPEVSDIIHEILTLIKHE